MSPLQILHERLGDALIVMTIIGQMDESNVDQHSSEIYALIDQLPEEGALIMNASGLEYMNSKAIGYTMDFFNKMNDKHGKFIIAESPPQIVDILDVVGLAQVIPMVTSLQEAKDLAGFDESMAMQAAVPTPAPMQMEEDQVQAKSSQNQKEQIAAQINISLGGKEENQEEMPEKQAVPEVSLQQESTEQAVVEMPEENPVEEDVPKEEVPQETSASVTVENEEEEPDDEVVAEEGGVPILGIAAIIAVVLVLLVIIFK